jgi:hypothetical protein
MMMRLPRFGRGLCPTLIWMATADGLTWRSRRSGSGGSAWQGDRRCEWTTVGSGQHTCWAHAMCHRRRCVPLLLLLLLCVLCAVYILTAPCAAAAVLRI